MTSVVRGLSLFCLTFLVSCSKPILQDFSGEIYGTTYSIKIADFYYRDSAENMVNRIKDETNIKKSVIKKLSKTKYRVLLGPFNDIKTVSYTHLTLPTKA